MRHELKIHPPQFERVRTLKKTHEVRSTTDRKFTVADVLHLREWDQTNAAELGADRCYTGRTFDVVVTDITVPGSFGLPDDVCVMSIRPWVDRR